MAPKVNLKKTQYWMQTVIMHPGTDQEAVAAKKSQALVPKRQFPQVGPSVQNPGFFPAYRHLSGHVFGTASRGPRL